MKRIHVQLFVVLATVASVFMTAVAAAGSGARWS